MRKGFELKTLVTEENEDEQLIIFKTNQKCISNKWPYIGILLASISSIFFSLCSVIVKWMVNVHPVELAVCRFFGVLLPCIPIVIWKNEPIFPKGKRLTLILRSFVGTTGLMCSFYAFRHMPLADASVIVFSVPVFVAIFAYIFLKEPCGWFNIVSIILTLIGVVLITRPTFIFYDQVLQVNNPKDVEDSWGAVAAMNATLFGASAYVLLRALKSLHFSIIMVNFGFFAVVQTVCISLYLGVFVFPKCKMELLLMIALALFSFAGQILLTLATQMENAGPVSVARTADIVFAFIWQVLFFDEVPNFYSITGAILVTSSVVLVGVRKWVLSLPDGSPLKLRLSIFTK